MPFSALCPFYSRPLCVSFVLACLSDFHRRPRCRLITIILHQPTLSWSHPSSPSSLSSRSVVRRSTARIQDSSLDRLARPTLIGAPFAISCRLAIACTSHSPVFLTGFPFASAATSQGRHPPRSRPVSTSEAIVASHRSRTLDSTGARRASRLASILHTRRGKARIIHFRSRPCHLLGGGVSFAFVSRPTSALPLFTLLIRLNRHVDARSAFAVWQRQQQPSARLAAVEQLRSRAVQHHQGRGQGQKGSHRRPRQERMHLLSFTQVAM